MVESEDHGVESVLEEDSFVSLHNFVEIGQFSLQNYLNQLVVRVGVGEDEHIRKDLSVGDLSHQQFNNYCCFLALDLESFGYIGRFSHCLVQHVQSLPVFPPDCLYFSSVEKVLAEFVVGPSFGERALLYQVVGSLEVAVFQIVPQKQVEDGALPNLVRSHTGAVQSFKEVLSDADVQIFFLVDSGVSMVEDCCVVVQSSPVGQNKFVEQVLDQFEALVVMPISPQDLHLEDADKTLEFKGFGDPANEVFVDLQFL